MMVTVCLCCSRTRRQDVVIELVAERLPEVRLGRRRREGQRPGRGRGSQGEKDGRSSKHAFSAAIFKISLNCFSS
jgi:hypothetical protein